MTPADPDMFQLAAGRNVIEDVEFPEPPSVDLDAVFPDQFQVPRAEPMDDSGFAPSRPEPAPPPDFSEAFASAAPDYTILSGNLSAALESAAHTFQVPQSDPVQYSEPQRPVPNEMDFQGFSPPGSPASMGFSAPDTEMSVQLYEATKAGMTHEESVVDDNVLPQEESPVSMQLYSAGWV